MADAILGDLEIDFHFGRIGNLRDLNKWLCFHVGSACDDELNDFGVLLAEVRETPEFKEMTLRIK